MGNTVAEVFVEVVFLTNKVIIVKNLDIMYEVADFEEVKVEIV